MPNIATELQLQAVGTKFLDMIYASNANNLGGKIEKLFGNGRSPFVLSMDAVNDALRGKTIEDRVIMKCLLARAGVIR
jgi:hypothetical protein